VTGAASGIGAELARQLAAAGHDLLLIDVTTDDLHRVAAELRTRHNIVAEPVICDLSDPDALRCLADELAEREISVLCANAGLGTFGPHVQTDRAWLHRQVMVNVLATHDLIRAVLPRMVERRSGGVLLIGSSAGNQPVPGAATYAATKAFVNSLGQALHQELRKKGIPCTVIAPGPVSSNFARNAQVQAAADAIPGPAWVSPQHAAAVALDGLARGRRRVIPGLAGTLFNLGGPVPRQLLLPTISSAIRRFVQRARDTADR
jgi:hypothetical protein